jgi:hypothetical protein
MKNKIEIVNYCREKEYSSVPLKVIPQFKQEIEHLIKKSVVENTYEEDSEIIEEEQLKFNDKEVCKTYENYIFCENVVKGNINKYKKNGFHFPTLDILEDKFDLEELEGKTFYSDKSYYYFFNEDEGWQQVDEIDEYINIDLILVK